MRDCDCGAVKREKSWYCFTLNFVFWLYIYYTSPPFTRHRLGYWSTLECLVGLRRPLLSREPLVVESRARRHSKALHKTHPKHLSELKVEVKFEVKVTSKLEIRRFDVLGPGDRDYRFSWLKLSQNVLIGIVKYAMSIGGILRKCQGHRSEQVESKPRRREKCER